MLGGTTGEQDGSNAIRAADGGDTIDGGAGNDFIHGGDGKDEIHGGLGDDFIIGGPTGGDDGSTGAPDLGDVIFGDDGNDTIRGGEGNDSITGGQGNDTIDVAEDSDTVFFTSKLDGHDVILNFNTGASHDTVNLDGLLDDLKIATADRDNRVEFFDVGADVELRVDTDGNTVNGFELTVATFQGVASTAALSDGNAAADDVFLGTGP
jgi:Ca2+-binding RTX toxin-like protein